MKMPLTGWFVLHVKHQHEKKIDSRLKEKDLESFLPCIATTRQWSDRKKKIYKPLFPSYIFLRINSKHDFHEALSITGVFKYLRFGADYAKVKEKEISLIKQLLNLEGISDIDTIERAPRIGAEMKINYGPLSGLNCKVIKANNNNRIFVEIQSLHKNITAKIPAGFLTEFA